jgi:hypothetical protein
MVAPRGEWTPELRRAAGRRGRRKRERERGVTFHSPTAEERKRILADILKRR